MRLTPFTLHRPDTIEAASDLLDELGPDALLYCGGTELLLVAKLGLTDFTHLVDVKPIDELGGIEEDGGELRIGATVTHRDIERSQLVTDHMPTLASMERAVGNLRVRNVGTIGGNLCFADPHSDPATYLIAAGGSVSMRRGGAVARRMAVEEFVRGPYETALAEGEMLSAIHVPWPTRGSALVHRKMSFHERPAITVAVYLSLGDAAVSAARIAVGSVGVTPRRAPEAERLLVGVAAAEPDRERLKACARAAGDESEPVADSNGSVEYKRQLVRVLTARCISDALTVAALDRA